MAQTVMDYAAFLAEARDALDSLTCDQNTLETLVSKEASQKREFETLRKSVEENISQTTRKRREEIGANYDDEIAKAQERLKRARARREKEKHRGMKERIAEETKTLKDANRSLKVQLHTLFQQSSVPSFCRTTLYYALYYPRSGKEILTCIALLLVCFAAIPAGIYRLAIPQTVRASWHLIVIYLIDIIVFGGLYLAINGTKVRYKETLEKGRRIKNEFNANEKKIRAITKAIQKDRNEELYDLERFDDEIAAVEEELSEIAGKKKDALETFESVTKHLIADEIRANTQDRMDEMKRACEDANRRVRELEKRVKEESIQITDYYGQYLGREFLQSDRIAELSKLIRSGQASNLTEAMQKLTQVKSPD